MYNTIYPGYIGKTYGGVPQVRVKPKQEEENSQQSRHAENSREQDRGANTGRNYFPNGEKTAIDYSRRQIGIDQIISDFKNTANAIGAPDEIKKEVNEYLRLIEGQSQKERPNAQIIQSNLKNASQILDEYITNTLKKPSKVVENWVDALFLQQINYKTEKNEEISLPVLEEQDKSEISAEKKNIEEEYKPSQYVEERYIPADKEAKRKFIQAKKYAAINRPDDASSVLSELMDYANNNGDEQLSAMVHYEQGRVYDGINNLNEALYNYNEAAQTSRNNDIKAKSHIYMGKIYDDYVKLDAAIEHYIAAASYAGESDNIKLQTQALSDLARVHAEKFDRENSIMFMDYADIAAEETKDIAVQAIISAKNAKNCRNLQENARALDYYGKSTKLYSQQDNNEKLAENYLKASEIMLLYGNKAKAKKLLTKAYISVLKTDKPELKKEITEKISRL